MSDSEDRANLGYRLQVVDHAFDIARLFLFLGFGLGCIYIIGDAIKFLAGKTTVADFVFGFITGESGTTITISIGLNIGLVIWGLNERQLRRRNIRVLAARVTELEARIDPDRTSSGLMPDGRTPRQRR